MRYHLCTLALALVAVTSAASAQSTSTQDTAQQPLNLDNAQKQQVTQGLNDQQVQAKPPGYDGQVGSKVPGSMQPHSMPGNVTAQVPQTKGYLFIKLPDRALLIDPDSLTVMALVPTDESGTGGTSDQSNQPRAGQKQ
jgi:hypothetical protein